MTIRKYRRTTNDPAFLSSLEQQIDPADTLTSFDQGDLQPVSIEFTDVSGNAQDDLDAAMLLLGYEAIDNEANSLIGTHHWGSFTTATEPSSAIASEGDSGYNTTLDTPVIYDGTNWIRVPTADATLTNNTVLLGDGVGAIKSAPQITIDGDIISAKSDSASGVPAFRLLTSGGANLGNLQYNEGSNIMQLLFNDGFGIPRITHRGTDPIRHIRTNSIADTDRYSIWETTGGTNTSRTNWFLTDRDPDGNITPSLTGDICLSSDSVTPRIYLNDGGTSADWKTVSSNTSSVHEIYTAAQLDAFATAGTITLTEDTTFIFKENIASATNYVLGGFVLQFRANGNEVVYTYTGTGTFISGDGRFDSGYSGVMNIQHFGGQTMFDITPTNPFHGVLMGRDLVVWIGPLGSVTGGVFIVETCSFVLFTSGVTLTNNLTVRALFLNVQSSNSSGAFLNMVNNTEAGQVITVDRIVHVAAGENLVNVDAAYDDTSQVSVTKCLTSGGGAIFDTAGTTGTFTAATGTIIFGATISSVADNGSGVARFTSALSHGLFTNQKVGHSGFSDSTYNVSDAIVTVITTTTYDIETVAFVADDSGTMASSTTTLTDTGTSLIDGDTLVISTDGSTDYDGGFTVFNQLTNSFDINATFTTDQSGTWDTGGLDQTDPRVVAFNQQQSANSAYIGSAFVNNNTTATGAIVNNTFADCVFGTAGSALIEGSNIERWKLVDDVVGVLEYTGNEPFSGFADFDVTAVSSGGSQAFRFKWVHDVGAGFVDLPDPVEGLVEIGSDASSVSKHIPLSAVKGDQIKLQITRNAGSSGVTTSYATFEIGN